MPDRTDPARDGASRREPAPPQVRLGKLMQGGLAPAILAIVERGVRRRPALARSIDVEVELAVHGGYPPVRIVFDGNTVLVEDGPAPQAGLRVQGELADLISLLVAPLAGGIPLPITARGRTALSMVATRRVRIWGRLGMLRRLLALIQI